MTNADRTANLSRKATMHDKGVWLSAIILAAQLILFAFSPPIALFLALSFVLLISAYRVDVPYPAVVGTQLIATIATVIGASSHPLFIYRESDFTTYYANYLKFLEDGFQFEFFEFGLGLEAGVPFLNYLFSLVIDGPYPYLVKALHAALQVTLLVILYRKVAVEMCRDRSEELMLFVLMLVFFKYGATLNHLLQGYASLLLLIGYYTKTKWIRRALIGIATVFHLTTLLVYPLIRFLLSHGAGPPLKRFVFAVPVVGVVIFFLLDFLTSLIANSPAVWLTKFRWAFTNVLEIDLVLLSLERSLVASAYLVGLLLIGIMYRIRASVWPGSTLRLLAILVFILSFGWLPGLSIRVLAALLTVLMGAIYFDYMVRRMRLRQAPLISFFLLVFFNLNWIVNSPLYYYSVPLAGSAPLYFVEPYGKIVSKVERNALPSEENILIKNPHR